MRTIILLLVALFSFSATAAQYNYPATNTVDSNDTYFGVTYKDPFRWLENTKQPETVSWFKRQANYTDSILNNLNGRDALIAEWEQMDGQFPSLITDRVYENGRIFYRKTTSAATVGKIYFRESMNGSEQLLFDPTAYLPGKMLSVQSFTPSYNGKMLAIEIVEQGAEISVIKIMDVDKKQLLKDSLYPAEEFFSWTFDNKSFLYQSLKSANIKDPTWRLNSKTKLHVLGADAQEDIDFFSNQSYPELNISPEVYPYAYLNEDAKNYIFAEVEENRYYAPIEEFKSKNISWKSLSTPSDSLDDLTIINDNVYGISHYNAPNYKIVATSLKHPDWANAITVASERADKAIKDVTYSKDYLLIRYSDGINQYLSKYNFKSKSIAEVKLPSSGTFRITCVNSKTNNCFLSITSWNKPLTEYEYDPVTDAFTPSSYNKPFVYPATYSDLKVEEIGVKGQDGVMIPLTIIRKNGIRKDGSNICLLEGYGAFGISISPYFDGLKNSLAARGVVIAFTHVRGGGEKGEAWHQAGFKRTKPNTWKDFITCAEYLIAKGYTSPQKLVGIGESAGGILISRAITERPELFAAAICNVGTANAMRLEFTGNTGTIREFGTVRDSIECRALYEMDGTQHVIKGIKYPAVICVAGWNDPRVPPWQPGKFAAALQNASTSGKPILMKVNYNSGHSTEDRNVTYINAANEFAFVLWQCGHPDFQTIMKKSSPSPN